MKPRLTVFLLALCAALPAGAQPKSEPPVAVRTVPPEYPHSLRRAGVGGVVTISCLVDEQGNVTELIVDKTTNDGFNPAALAAVKKWKFKPATVDGVPVTKKVIIPLRFAIEET